MGGRKIAAPPFIANTIRDWLSRESNVKQESLMAGVELLKSDYGDDGAVVAKRICVE